MHSLMMIGQPLYCQYWQHNIELLVDECMQIHLFLSSNIKPSLRLGLELVKDHVLYMYRPQELFLKGTTTYQMSGVVSVVVVRRVRI